MPPRITNKWQTGINLLNNQPVAIKFEPRKSDAPQVTHCRCWFYTMYKWTNCIYIQLRDEHRSYKIMAGSRKIPQMDSYLWRQRELNVTLHSRCSERLLFWSRGIAQYSCDRFIRAKFRRFIWHVWKKAFRKDCGHARQTNGIVSMSFGSHDNAHSTHSCNRIDQSCRECPWKKPDLQRYQTR